MCNPGGVLGLGVGWGVWQEDDADLPAGATMADRVFAALDSGGPTKGWFEPGSPMCMYNPRVAIKLCSDGTVEACASADGGATTVWFRGMELYQHGLDEQYLAYVTIFASLVRRRYFMEWRGAIEECIASAIGH